MLIHRRRRSGESGQILVMFAFSMLFLIVGMIAVAVDLSQLYEVRVRLQNAAEQAAMAGASQINYLPAESASSTLLPTYASTCRSAGDDFSRVIGSTTCANPNGTAEVVATVSVRAAVTIPIPGVGGSFTVTATYTAAPVIGGLSPVG
jgi:Flp pilus assembly protein TadG